MVRGRVLRPDDSPHPHAVVTAVRLTGEPLDWSRADNTGRSRWRCRAGTVPGDRQRRRWTPRSQVTEFAAPDLAPVVRLGGPLLLTGTVRRAGEPVAGALLTLSATTGEVRATTISAADGGYRLRLPPPGHHILTVLAPDRLVSLR